MSDIYSNVDAAESPYEALAWQQRVDSWPAIMAYKRRTYELVGDGLVLDVGVGPGSDAAALGVDRCIGFDVSSTMCSAAAGLGIKVARADVTRLPARSGSFDGVRADRVIQHVGEPDAALREMLRILRPGGRVVLCDPDQGSLRIHVEGTRSGLSERVKKLRRDVGYLNGCIATSYASRFDAIGLFGITEDVFSLELTDPRDAFGIEQWPRIWRDRGIGDFEENELKEWEQALATRGADFVYALKYLVVSGVKP